MKKIHVFGIVLLMILACVGAVSAYGDIKFPYDGTLSVTYNGYVTAGYNNEYGIDEPVHMSLGFSKQGYPKSFNVGRCIENEPVVLFITSPTNAWGGSKTYYSDRPGDFDGLNHANIYNADGVYTVLFEDVEDALTWADYDFNDVNMTVSCEPDAIVTPEFPTLALPAAFIVGLIGAVLFIKSTKEN
jgi:hypothetical protein